MPYYEIITNRRSYVTYAETPDKAKTKATGNLMSNGLKKWEEVLDIIECQRFVEEDVKPITNN